MSIETDNSRDVVGRLRPLMPAGSELSSLCPDAVEPAALHCAEAALVEGAPLTRVRQFAAGRVGARRLLERLGHADAPVLAASDGSAIWPADTRGSITHKPQLCLVVAGSVSTWSGVGVDLEPARVLPAPVRDVVLTADERLRFGGSPDAEVHARVAFSAKEAYYKWFKSCGLVGEPRFREVEVSLGADSLEVVPSRSVDLRPASGRYVVGTDWIVVVLWS